MIIYKTINLINGKYYVGQDSKNKPSYLGSGILLKRSIEKHGRENFKKEIIAWCDTRDKLNFLEKFYIDFYGSRIPDGYNLTDGGDSGWKHSEETKRKIGKNQFGDNNVAKRPEVREILSKQKMGDKNPAKQPGVGKKISEAKKGRGTPWMIGDLNPMKNPETVKKVSATLMGHKCPWALGDLNSSKRIEVREKMGRTQARIVKNRKRASNGRFAPTPSPPPTICPRCGAVNSPDELGCGCMDQIFYPYNPYPYNPCPLNPPSTGDPLPPRGYTVCCGA